MILGSQQQQQQCPKIMNLAHKFWPEPSVAGSKPKQYHMLHVHHL